MNNNNNSFVVLAGVGAFMAYQYTPSIPGYAATFAGFAYANNKLADIAIRYNNPGACDYLATISEFLEKIPGGFFSKFNSARALYSGVEYRDPEMVGMALAHGADANMIKGGMRVLERALETKSADGNLIAQKLIQKVRNKQKIQKARSSLAYIKKPRAHSRTKCRC